MNRKPMTMSLSRGLRWLLMACALPWASAQGQSFSTGFQIPAWHTQPYDHYTADTWTIWGGNFYDRYVDDESYQPLGVPPVDANGNPWYAYDYTLTNDAADVLPNGDPIVWQEQQAPFCNWEGYEMFPDTDTEGNFYMRRYFTTDETKAPESLRLYVAYDDAPCYVYLNGELIFSLPNLWNAGAQWVDISEYAYLLKLNGEKNVIAATICQINSDYYLDCGLYSNSLTYEVNDEENHTVTVYGSGELTGALEIPATVDYQGVTYTVNRIRENAFSNQQLTSVIIPETVTCIEWSAFAWNSNLTEVNLPAGLKELYWGAFEGCNSLATLEIPQSVESLECPVSADQGTNVIAYQALYNNGLVCAPIDATEFEVEDGNNTIGYYAFAGCKDLTSITLPISITTIYGGAFQNCTSLTDLYYNVLEVPDLPEDAFDGTDKSKITIHTYAPAVADFKAKWGEEFTYVTEGTPENIELTIACTQDDDLNGLIQQAISDQNGDPHFVTKITVTGTIPEWNLGALAQYTRKPYQCSVIDLSGADLYYDSELGNYWSGEFNNSNVLAESIITKNNVLVAIPWNVEGEYTIPAGVTTMWSYALANRENLTSVIIPESVTAIGNCAFEGWSKLYQATFEGLTPPACTSWTWDNSSINDGTVYVHLAAISDYQNAGWGFYGKFLPIEETTATINVTEAGTLQATLEASEYASVIQYLTGITVTGKVNADDMQYLANLCSNNCLTIIDLGEAVMEGQTNWQSWFSSHKLLKTISLPKNLTSLDDWSFGGCQGLEEVVLSETITYIGNEAFRECVNLTTVSGLENVISENQYSSNAIFYGCTSLTEPIYNDKVFFYLPASYTGSYEVPEGIEQICSSSMGNCTDLTEVTLPESVQKMGYNIFNGCELLTTINSYAIEPPTGWGMFGGLDSEKVTIYVPLYALTAYRNASSWSEMNITSFEGIDEPMFSTGDSYVLPSTVNNPNEPYMANIWVINGPEYDGTNSVIVGVPPFDAEGHAWYEVDYTLTNSAEDVNYDGTEVVWEERQSPFWDNYLESDHIGDIYLRRSFTIEAGTELPAELYLSCSFDDSPAEYFINGVLVYSELNPEVWYDGAHNVLLTAEQRALLKTDGTENVIAAHASQNYGGSHIDCGIFGGTELRYEIISADEVRLLGNTSYGGDLVIPETVTVGGNEYKVVEIAEGAFHDDDALTSVVIPATVRKIYANAFSYCDQLSQVTILGEGLESVGDYAFYDCNNLAVLVLPKSVTECNGNVVNYWNTDLQCYLTLYNDNTLVAAPIDATEFTIKEGTTEISNYAFSGCSDLTTVYIPRSVSNIGSYAFRNCTSLTEITYKTISPYWINTETVFEGVDPSAVTVNVYECALENFQNNWGTEFNYVTMPDPVPVTLTINVEEPSTLAELILEEVAKLDATVYDVVGITITGELNADDLYDNDYSLRNLSRSPYALAEMNLEGATVPDNEIRWDGFYGSRMLTDVVLPSNLESLNWFAFQACVNLQTIVLPETLTYLDNYAFDSDYNLRAITCYAVNPPELAGSNVFNGVEQSTCILFVPAEAVDTYKATEIWQDFDIHAIGEVLVTLTPAEVSIYPNNGYQLEVYSTLEDDTFTWTSSDEEIVTVDEVGYITAVAPGEATITVTSSAGAEATSQVTVLKYDDWIYTYWNLASMCYIGNSFNLAEYLGCYSGSEVYFSISEGYESIVELSGTTLTCLAAGDFELYAWTDGDDWYNPASSTFNLSVIREKPDHIYDNLNWSELYVGAVIDLDEYFYTESGLPVSYQLNTYSWGGDATLDGSILTCLAEGYIELYVYTEGNEDWQPCSSYYGYYVQAESPKEDQWINWWQDFDDVFAGNIIPLEAWASSGLQVEYEIVEGSQYATMIDATTLGCMLPGTIVVRASQPGNEWYNEAAPVEKTIEIKVLSSIDSIAADTEIELYSIAGYLVFKGRAADREYIAPGIYVLRIGNQTYKVAIK